MLTFIRSIDLSNELRSIPPKIIPILVQVGLYTITASPLISAVNANNLPVAADIPEEVLRAEIITEARSPIDGKALSASDFAELVVNTKQQLEREDAIIATSGSRLKQTLLLLRLRGFLRSLGIPIN